MIAIIDYKAGNLTSVRKAFDYIGAKTVITDDPAVVRSAAKIVLPGVGNFAATRALDSGLRDAVNEGIGTGKPFLGICVGMQWMFTGSEECPDAAGLAAISGSCAKFPPDVKSPHVGWNQIHVDSRSRLMRGIASGSHVYFTHSYRAPLVPETVAETIYGGGFSAAVERDNIYGVQFHPEKSGEAGLQMLRNFCELRSSNVCASVQNNDSGPERLTKRIIACLDVHAGRVVKGVNFVNLRDAGDPAELAHAHSRNGADEVVLLDITATHENRGTLLDAVRRTAKELFIPFTVGGGIRTLADAGAIFDAGADKISINSAAIANPSLITEIAERFGSQAVIVAADVKRAGTRYEVFVSGGRKPTGRDVIDWVKEAEERGAGEILLTSMDRDGTGIGFECELTRAVSQAVNIPVIASGGAGGTQHFVEVFREGQADAALAASIFHFGLNNIRELKEELRNAGIPMRLPC